MKKRKLYLKGKLTVKRQEKEVMIMISNESFLVIASQTLVDIIKIFLTKKSKIVNQDSNNSQGHSHGIHCTM